MGDAYGAARSAPAEGAAMVGEAVLLALAGAAASMGQWCACGASRAGGEGGHDAARAVGVASRNLLQLFCRFAWEEFSFCYNRSLNLHLRNTTSFATIVL
jgi:hypothetical protein